MLSKCWCINLAQVLGIDGCAAHGMDKPATCSVTVA